MTKKLTLLLLLAVYCVITVRAQTSDVFTTSVTFPANYVVGDYIEFGQAFPIAANASGFYEISIVYTRGNVAAAATHIASASHVSPDIWLEAGRVNHNIYVTGANNFNFTVDVNPSNHRFRIRAVNTLGVASQSLPVDIKVRSVNFTNGFSPLNNAGNTTAAIGRLSMTSEWDLIVGDLATTSNATQAIKVISNGNVGIGTTTPTEKLAVNGTVRAKEIRVEAAPWPDYVFDNDYNLMPLSELAAHLNKHKHLPNMPTAKTIAEKGVDLGEMNRKLLEKVEELTLYILDNRKEIDSLKQELQAIKKK